MKNKDTMKVKGFFRVQITEDGKGVVGDSGWKEVDIEVERLQKDANVLEDES